MIIQMVLPGTSDDSGGTDFNTQSNQIIGVFQRVSGRNNTDFHIEYDNSPPREVRMIGFNAFQGVIAIFLIPFLGMKL